MGQGTTRPHRGAVATSLRLESGCHWSHGNARCGRSFRGWSHARAAGAVRIAAVPKDRILDQRNARRDAVPPTEPRRVWKKAPVSKRQSSTAGCARSCGPKTTASSSPSTSTPGSTRSTRTTTRPSCDYGPANRGPRSGSKGPDSRRRTSSGTADDPRHCERAARLRSPDTIIEDENWCRAGARHYGVTSSPSRRPQGRGPSRSSRAPSCVQPEGGAGGRWRRGPLGSLGGSLLASRRACAAP